MSVVCALVLVDVLCEHLDRGTWHAGNLSRRPVCTSAVSV